MQRLKKGDNVKIISGGQKGKIAKVEELKGSTVILEKLGVRERHYKANQVSPAGKREIRTGVHISNVMLVDDSEKATRVKFEVKNEQKVRVAKTSGKEIK
jgi:large subunit ribosomal protein L24